MTEVTGKGLAAIFFPSSCKEGEELSFDGCWKKLKQEGAGCTFLRPHIKVHPKQDLDFIMERSTQKVLHLFLDNKYTENNYRV